MTPSRTKRDRKRVKDEKMISEKNREAVLADFRKIAGPLRGRNRAQKPKS